MKKTLIPLLVITALAYLAPITASAETLALPDGIQCYQKEGKLLLFNEFDNSTSDLSQVASAAMNSKGVNYLTYAGEFQINTTPMDPDKLLKACSESAQYTKITK